MAEIPKEYMYLSNMDHMAFPAKMSELTVSSNANNSDPYQNYMFEEGIYSQDSHLQPMGYGTPAHTRSEDDSTLLNDLENMNLDNMNGFDTMNFDSLPLLGNLPPDLTSVMNSILTDNFDFGNIEDYDHLDVATAAVSWPDDDLAVDMLATGTSTIDSTPINGTDPSISMGATALMPTQTRPRRKTRKTKANNHAMDEMSAAPFNHEPYPSLDELGVPSPASSCSYYSDTGSSNEDVQRPRQRRPRVSYSTLSEEEKYKRIRDLNNEASRHYREKQKKQFAVAENQLPQLLEKNKHLQHKAAQLEQLKNKMQMFSNTFLKQHMPQTQNFSQY